MGKWTSGVCSCPGFDWLQLLSMSPSGHSVSSNVQRKRQRSLVTHLYCLDRVQLSPTEHMRPAGLSMAKHI
jgi:hypothetical protein